MTGTCGIRLQHKVPTVDSSAVDVVKDQASVAEEGHVVAGRGDVQVHILCVILAVLRNHFSMLSRQITNLAELWCCRVAGNIIGRTARLDDMWTSGGAVAILWNPVCVDVIAWTLLAVVIQGSRLATVTY